MTPDSLKLYKLIILYFLQETGQEMSNAILSDFILEHGYTDYLSIQETLSGLTEDGQIQKKQTHNAAYYRLSERGKETLSYFGEQLPKGTKDQIHDYLKKNKIAITKAMSVITDYECIKKNEYLATGTIKERGSTLLEVSINLPTKEAAMKACNNLKAHQEELYQAIYQIVTKE